jgi:DNA primase
MLNYISFPIVGVAERCGVKIGKTTGRAEVRADCPFCNGHRRSMSLNTAKNVFYCHHCGERGNSVQLYSKLMGADARTAYRELAANNLAA